jgi:preprotein translocase subunit SecG
MLILLTIIHVILCFFLIIVVLLQSGKAADLAGAFGGMGSQTAFGPRGAATLLSKATTTAAVLFMLTSIALGILHSREQGSGQSVIERTETTTEAPATATPVPPATESGSGGSTSGETPAAQPETTAPAPGTTPAQEKGSGQQ